MSNSTNLNNIRVVNNTEQHLGGKNTEQHLGGKNTEQHSGGK